MQMTLRWYGSKYDTVTLKQIRQIPGVTGLVWALHQKQPGEVWEVEEIEEVDPEFKAALDQYEVFIDGYCDFLEVYLKADTNTQLSMMADYAEWMSQYAEVMDAVRTLDACQDEMTPAQLSYYIEITARVSQRMIEFSERCE